MVYKKMNELINDIAYKSTFKSAQRPKNLKVQTAHTDPQIKHSLKIFHDDNDVNNDNVENKVNK